MEGKTVELVLQLLPIICPLAVALIGYGTYSFVNSRKNISSKNKTTSQQLKNMENHYRSTPSGKPWGK